MSQIRTKSKNTTDKQLKFYGLYDLTEDILKSEMQEDVIDRQSELFKAERQKVSRLLKCIDIPYKQKGGKLSIPADQYEEFLMFFKILYFDQQYCDTFKKSVLSKTKPTLRKIEKNTETIEDLLVAILKSKEGVLVGKAKELYKIWAQDVISPQYNVEMINVRNRLNKKITSDLEHLDELLTDEDKIKFLEIYENHMIDMSNTLMDICNLKIENDAPIKNELYDFWTRINANELNKIINESNFDTDIDTDIELDNE